MEKSKLKEFKEWDVREELYNVNYLKLNCVEDEWEDPYMKRVKRTIKIPRDFILTERARSNNSLSEGCVIQLVMMSLFNCPSWSVWALNQALFSFDCEPEVTDTHRIYKFNLTEYVAGKILGGGLEFEEEGVVENF